MPAEFDIYVRRNTWFYVLDRVSSSPSSLWRP